MPKVPDPMDINPSSHKQFEIWKLGFPLGKEHPVEYVLVISNTRGLQYSREPQVAVLPLYYSRRAPPQMSKSGFDFPFIQGGKETFHGLPYPVFIATDSVVTILKVGLIEKMSHLNQVQREQVKNLFNKRFSFD
jgi:hypothetical protein